jgi:hypothetical protein
MATAFVSSGSEGRSDCCSGQIINKKPAQLIALELFKVVRYSTVT